MTRVLCNPIQLREEKGFHGRLLLLCCQTGLRALAVRGHSPAQSRALEASHPEPQQLRASALRPASLGGMDAAVDWYLAVPLLFTILAVILASLFVKLRSSEGDKAAEAAAAKEGGAEPRVREAQAGAAAARVDGGGRSQDGDGREQQPPKTRLEEEDVPESGRRGPGEEIGAGDPKEEGKGTRGEDAAAAQARTEEAGQQSHPQEVKVPSQAAAAAAAAAVEVGEEEEEEEEEEDEEEEESKEEDQESENEKLVVKEPETEDGSCFEDDGRNLSGHTGSSVDEQFSFKYSPGKLRGNQYKTMMTKEELEEEQRLLQTILPSSWFVGAGLLSEMKTI
ncbi:matrix-remodeling-associated protein 7 isoform X2 [Tiliqua scincoides]|uniref:matrix-remodeling-associated protein 7 isoform X2 n=1 Tax=Tiliqua scincoides TaxID=71010 RepID=UPI0034627876